ncbi:MAG: branched-chain amino acid transaminase [Vicinamibacterales bacterium]
MAFSGTGKVWMNGALVDWKDANIHIASHVVHYGSGVFEGARCYDTKKGPACFRLDEHVRRLVESARIYRMEPPYDAAAIRQAILDTILANDYTACYIRPIVYRGYEALGVNPFPCPVDVAIILWDWTTMFAEESLVQGIDVKVSTWTRIAPNTLPALAKSVANYANSQLIKMEALVEGYSEAIALDWSGAISEGSGQNVFLVRDGVLYTPPPASSVLGGITRDSVIAIARDLGIELREQVLPREMLYLADEAFFAGTAVEVTPIRSIDKIKVGRGTRGPITEAIQARFFGIVRGEAPDTHGWLTYLGSPVGTGTAKSGAVKSR